MPWRSFITADVTTRLMTISNPIQCSLRPLKLPALSLSVTMTRFYALRSEKVVMILITQRCRPVQIGMTTIHIPPQSDC